MYNKYKSDDGDKVGNGFADERVPGWCEGRGCIVEISSPELHEERQKCRVERCRISHVTVRGY